MKALFLSAACIALAGCAGSAVAPDEQSTQAGAPEARDQAVSPAAALEGANLSAEDVKVVEVGRTEIAEEQVVVCERETPFGSRIARERCYVPVHEAQARLERRRLQSEMTYARELAILDEHARLQDAAAARGAADTQ